MAFAVLGVALASCSVEKSAEDGLTPREREIAALPTQEPGTVEEFSVPVPGQVDPPPNLEVLEFGDDDGYLNGPHFSVKLSWMATGTAIEENGFYLVRDLEPRRAGDGQELVVFAVSPEYAGGQWTLGSQPPPIAELVIDGQEQALHLVPLPDDQDVPVEIPDDDGALVVASVPEGAQVQLRVTDLGRTQTLDVRSGKRGVDAITGYYQPYSQELSFSERARAGFSVRGVPYPMKINLRDRGLTDVNVHQPQAFLAPWAPKRGWAPKGRAWLLMPHPILSTEYTPSAPEPVFLVSEPSVFQVRLPGGKAIPELGGRYRHKTWLAETGGRRADLVFSVPADFRAGTFEVVLANLGLLARYRNATLPGLWSPAPKTVKLSIDLAK